MIGASALDDPEGWYGEGGGRRVQDGEYMYTCGGFILIFGRSHSVSIFGPKHSINAKVTVE